MQRLTSAYRASLVLAATNAGASFAQREAPGESHGGFGLRRRADDRRDVDDHDTHHDVDYRDLSDYDDQPTYWYWSYDHPDAGI